MKKSGIIYIAIAAAGAIATYMTCRHIDKKQKEFEEHKEEVLSNPAGLDTDIRNASLNNEKLDIEDRIKAKEVLEHFRFKVNSARTIDSFDKAWQKMSGLLVWINNGDADSAKSLVNYEHRKLLKMQEQKEKERDRIAELERVKALGTAFGNLIPDVNVAPVIKNVLGEVASNAQNAKH